MSYIIRSLFGPHLNRIYQPASGTDRAYEANAAERYGSLVISVIHSMFNLGYYSSPFLVVYMYRRDWYSPNGFLLMAEILAAFGCLYSTSLCLRALGRGVNPAYRDFLDALSDAQRSMNPGHKAKLSAYDFDFKSWPVEFSAGVGTNRLMFVRSSAYGSSPGWTPNPYRVLSWLMVQSFGISLVYPGSMSLLQAGIAEALQQGRAKYVLEKQGKRFKLQSADKNDIDVMFFDRRNVTALGSTLVISCEGNAGFYEVGVAATPIEAGYSVLGWNHPGFGGSTGTPFPSQEANAIDAVMQFALEKLGFAPDDIIIHGWSIGGYTASWAAMNYPDVRGVILDATFDHLMPLAVPRMPEVMEPLVRTGVAEYVNLNVADQLVKFNGPIKLIRRAMDEMISTDPADISSNRGNHLLKRLLSHRYPNLFSSKMVEDTLDAYLSTSLKVQEDLIKNLNIGEDDLLALISQAAEDDGGPRSYPSSLGDGLNEGTRAKMALYLAKQYMTDFDSSHCTQLPSRLFTLPSDSFSTASSTQEDSFVKV